jgi:hypothetical protein
MLRGPKNGRPRLAFHGASRWITVGLLAFILELHTCVTSWKGALPPFKSSPASLHPTSLPFTPTASLQVKFSLPSPQLAHFCWWTTIMRAPAPAPLADRARRRRKGQGTKVPKKGQNSRRTVRPCTTPIIPILPDRRVRCRTRSRAAHGGWPPPAGPCSSRPTGLSSCQAG